MSGEVTVSKNLTTSVLIPPANCQTCMVLDS